MKGPPAAAERLLRRLLPEEIADALLGDLEEGYRRRRGRDGRLRAGLWYWGQALQMPYAALRREAGRLRRSRWKRVRTPARGGWTMGRVLEDLRIGARSLRRRPAFSAVLAGTLAASIAAATLIFSVLETVVMRTLPYPDADRLVTLYSLNDAWRAGESAQLRELWDRYPVALDQVEAARRVPGLAAVGAVGTGEVVLRGEAGARRVPAGMVSEGLFGTLGVEPALGRLPGREELAGGAPVVVVSHRFWTERLGRDPEAPGRVLELDGEPATVVGVMPDGFWFPTPRQEIWRPIPADLLLDGRTLAVLTAVGRLAPGASLADVDRAVDARSRQLAEGDPARAGFGMRAALRRDEALAQVRGGLTLFAGAVVLVVLLAAVNLANLVLARAVRREGELAVRRALGGGRLAVTWAVVAEVLLLCVVGGAAGVLLAAVLLDPFAGALSTVDMLRGTTPRLNAAVLAFAAATTILAALAGSLPVAWRASHSFPARALGESRRTGGGRGIRRTQRALLAAESGLAFLLLAGAVLLIRSVAGLAAVDSGYAAAELSFVEVALPASASREDPVAGAERLEALAEGVGRRIGAPSALVAPVPTTGEGTIEPLRLATQDAAGDVGATRAGPGFFDVSGLPLLRGRGFLASDGPEAPGVVVVGETLARRLAPGGDALGVAVVVGREPDARRATVVGVAADARMLAIPVEADEHVYLPFAQFPRDAAAVLVRHGEGSPPTGLREAVGAVAPEVIVERTGTVEALAWEVLGPVKVRAVLLGALSGLALLLAAVGVAGLAAHAVEERVREIGIRIALGAAPRRETLRVARSFLLTVGLGTVVGLAAALAASRAMGAFLYEVEPLDPASYAVAALLLSALGGLAAWVPARRAARVDPVEVLNRE